MWKAFQEIWLYNLIYQLGSFKSASSNEKLTGVSVFNAKEPVLKKMNVLLFIYLLVNTASVSMLSERILYIYIYIYIYTYIYIRVKAENPRFK